MILVYEMYAYINMEQSYTFERSSNNNISPSADVTHIMAIPLVHKPD